MLVGANLIEHIKCSNKIGSDNNEFLISMWNSLQQGWKPPSKLSRSEYHDIRLNQTSYPKELVAIAGLCATYNAKWFGGYAGIVTTKHGNVRDYYDERIRNLLKQVSDLKNVKFVYADYSNWNDVSGYLIYCDPPYANTTKYKSEFDSEKFWQWVKKMSIKNTVLVSEYTAPPEFTVIFEKELAVTLDKNSRRNEVEKLFYLK